MWKLAGLLSGAALVLMTAPAILLTVAMSDSEVDTVAGTVRYADGDVDLPRGAFVEVVLVGVSDADASAVALGRHIIEDAATLPVEFRVPYNADWLTPGATHELWVAVRHEGNLLYATRSEYPVELGRSLSGIDVAVAPLASP